LIVGVDDTQYFPIYASDGSDYYGFSQKLLSTFAKKYNYTFSYRILPVKRLYMAFWNKEVDFKYPDSPYWKAEERVAKEVHYTNPIVDYIDGVVVKPKRLGAGIENFKRLGLVRGFTPFALLKDIKERRIEVVKNNSLSGMLKQVMTGRTDGAYINIDIARYQMRERFRNAGDLILTPNYPT